MIFTITTIDDFLMMVNGVNNDRFPTDNLFFSCNHLITGQIKRFETKLITWKFH